MDRNSLPQRLWQFWPGLPGLWQQGRWLDLLLAVVFSNLLVLVVLTTFVWPDLLPTSVWAVVCFGVACSWAVFGLLQIRRESCRHNDLRANEGRKHLFRVAQTEYLRGNWFQAETTLKRLLDTDSGDVEARLLLATLLRRVQQPRSAGKQLELVERSRRATDWDFEIAHERRLLGLMPEGDEDGGLNAPTDSLAGEAA